MSSLVLTGDTSGSGTITVPAVAGTFTATIGSATGTHYPFTSGTVVSASGTSIDFTSIPSWVKRITVMFSGVSTNGTSRPMVQLGSGSILSSGYVGQSIVVISGAATSGTGLSSGFQCGIYSANTEANFGAFTFFLLNSNTWVCVAQVGNSTYNASCTCSGSVALSGTLDRVRITTVNGTDTFDAGSINILYE